MKFHKLLKETSANPNANLLKDFLSMLSAPNKKVPFTSVYYNEGYQ